MKKYLIYIGILALGLLLGWLIFGGSSSNEEINDHSKEMETAQMWTCSMHPQIMQSEPGDCPICGMDLIPVETSEEGLGVDQFRMTKNAMALANIQTSLVGMGKGGDNVVTLSGKIMENEESNAVQVSYFSGRIERLNINFTGETVQKGQLLAAIYSPDLFAAQQELITASSLKESQSELYQAVRNKLKLWKLSENQIDQIEASGVVRENFPVYATVSGTVSEKLVEQGDYVKQGQPLLKIANLNTVWANFDVYEHQIELFKKGQEISITTNANPNRVYKARVSFIDPVLDTKTRTVKLRAVLDNRGEVFKPGMFVEGKVAGIKLDAASSLLIPATALLWTGERSVVYLKANPEEPVFEMRDITLGNKVGETYEVLEGLENGDEIVTNGTFTVDAAAQLQGKRSMMNKEGGKTMTGHEGHNKLQNNDIENNTTPVETNERIKVSTKFQAQLRIVFDDYIRLKNALVKDDSIASKVAANSILANLNKVDMELLKDAKALNHWMSVRKDIEATAQSISKSIDIERQRNHFKHLSSNVIIAVQLFGVNQKVYNQFCPMADDNKGAYWLSIEKELFNPYFGSAMLKCGSVKQTID